MKLALLKYYSIVFLGNYDEGPIVFIAVDGKASYETAFILQNESYAPCEGYFRPKVAIFESKNEPNCGRNVYPWCFSVSDRYLHNYLIH